jgi:hypothetical protein
MAFASVMATRCFWACAVCFDHHTCSFRVETDPSSPSNAILRGISATDGRQSAFHVSDVRICAAHLFLALTGLHLAHKTRLQLIIFSRIHYLYTA